MAEPQLEIEERVARLEAIFEGSEDVPATAESLEIPDEFRDEVRKIAREEIASLCGLVLRRASSTDQLSSIFGEALNDFSENTAGEEPGEN